MARKPRVPAYSLHKPSGKAVVKLTIDGSRKSLYLGDYGSDESREAYARIVADVLSGRPIDPPSRIEKRGTPTPKPTITVGELAKRYKAHAETYYRKNGKITSEVHIVRRAMEFLTTHHADLPAGEFTIGDLKAVRRAMVDSKVARSTVNKYCDRVRRAFVWGAAEELLPAIVAQGLAVLPGLRAGRTEAKDRPAVAPVDRQVVESTLPHLPRTIADMVRLQLLCAMRPDEVCRVRPCDIDRSGDVWLFTLDDHKCAHHGKSRVVFVGPEAQKILTPYLLRPSTEYCFRPSRITKVPRARRHYKVSSYRRAITRVCEAKGIDRWAPNQLRHTAATAIREKFGLESAAVMLGHANMKTSEIYAEKSVAAGIAAARQIG